MNFYCNPQNPRKAIQPSCRVGNIRNGLTPGRTLPFTPYDPFIPSQFAVTITKGLVPQAPPFWMAEDYDPCNPKPKDMSGVLGRWSEGEQYGRHHRKPCCPTPASARYIRKPAGRGFVATPESHVRLQMIKMMRDGHACDAGCTARGHELQNLLNIAPCPCPININVTAQEISSAKNEPCHVDELRRECRLGPVPEKPKGCGGIRYLPMNWGDILGKAGMKVTSTGDPGNQMKVSIVEGECGDNGGQKKTEGGDEKECGDKKEEEKSPLRVVTVIQPVNECC